MKETQIWPPILTILLPPLNYNLRWLKMVLCIAINNRSYLEHAVIFGKLYIVVEKFSKMSHVYSSFGMKNCFHLLVNGLHIVFF